MKNKSDKDVGYGKPPKHSQFKKGQSGNPGGRPRKLKSMKELLAEGLNSEVTVNGKVMTKIELLVVSLVNDAIKGKSEARRLVMSQMSDDEDLEEFDPKLDDEIAWMKLSRKVQNRKEEA